MDNKAFGLAVDCLQTANDSRVPAARVATEH